MKPISGKKIFNALKDQNCIVLAANIRIIPGVGRAIFRAAKDMDAALIVELARTECNQHKGYTGLTPETYSKYLFGINEEIGHDIWALHADHIGIMEGTKEDMDDTKDMIDMQVKSGYTSFAIDASHLYNFEGKNIEEELKPNIDATIELGKYITDKVGNSDFGLEVEVGEIGKKNDEGMVLTTPEEAVIFIKKVKDAGLEPDLIAIANGSTHGNVYDKEGKLMPLVSIDIELTKNVAKALRDAGYNVRIAQHGITGTPIEMIKEKFPKGDILKGNVATLFQNIAFDTIKKHNRKLYDEMFNWVLKNKPLEDKAPEETFGKNSKHAIKVFFERIYAMDEACKNEIEERCYEEAKKFIDAFNSKDTASIVRKAL